jgi:putative metalloenzyme radical SAM/SPASM domain maturase
MTPGQLAINEKDWIQQEGPEHGHGSRSTGEEANEGPAFRRFPSRLFVETTTRCNLKCSMCVKQTEDCGIIEGDMPPDVFSALEPAFPTLETLVLNGIGEPLLHPELENFIRKAKAAMPQGSWIGFQSNGLELNEVRAAALVEAGLDRICLSMDSLSEDTFREIREGGEVQDMERAFAALRKAKTTAGRDLQIGIEFVVMRDNAHELPLVLRWAAKQGASFAIVTHLLPYDNEHAEKIAYDLNSEQALAFFQEWKERAEREGINLETYFKVRWNYLRSPEEQQVVDFVTAMQADGRARGISFHMKNLMARDEKWLDRLAQIFAEAERTAKEIGLDLSLPAIIPKNNTGCEFVDNGSAFISWNGDVHNCYFLWHKFSCWYYGQKRYVNNKSFGNLAEKGIEEIWNSPAFIKHRKGVLGKDYSTCSDCNLTPCDNVYREDFEHDCFVNPVPCGSCFWSKGLFRCLQ